MMRPRGVFLLECIVYVAIMAALFASVAGTITLVGHGLAEGLRSEQLQQERARLSELLSDDLRMSQTIAWTARTSKSGAPEGSTLRLTRPDGSVTEYTFVERDISVTGWSPKTTPVSPRTLVTQTVAETPSVTRTVFVNAVQKSSRHWDCYALKKLECSRQNGVEQAWELDEQKIGAALDARAAHLFLLLTLDYIHPGKPSIRFAAGATTRIDPVAPKEKQP